MFSKKLTNFYRGAKSNWIKTFFAIFSVIPIVEESAKLTDKKEFKLFDVEFVTQVPNSKQLNLECKEYTNWKAL